VTDWKEDPRLPYAIAALLGMIAGVAAKQAVAIQSGNFPKPYAMLADILVLGMVWLIVMYVHGIRPGIPLEGIALLAAALAMWGPRGIAALLNRFKHGALNAADSFTRSVLDPVEPVHRPTVVDAVDRERQELDGTIESENKFAQKAPIRKLRDKMPIESLLPADEVKLLGEIDQVFTKKEEEKENGNGTEQ
jgi:hypothetical protein